MSNHSCFPELLLAFAQMCTVLEFRILWNFFLWLYLLPPNHLLAKYSGFYFYLAAVRDFYSQNNFFCFSTIHHVSVFVWILACVVLNEWQNPIDSLLLLPLVILLLLMSPSFNFNTENVVFSLSILKLHHRYFWTLASNLLFYSVIFLFFFSLVRAW